MQFSQVIGQDVLKRELSELMQENRLAHTMLFLGKEGSGALPLAIAFAQSIVCNAAQQQQRTEDESSTPSLFGNDIPPIPNNTAPLPAGTACGVCPACIKMTELVHPDVHFSYPVVTKKSGTPPISTDYIKEWREFLKLHPYGNVYDWLQLIGAENKQGNITAQECNDIIHKLNLKSFEGGIKVLIMWMPEYLRTEGNRLLKLIEEPPEKTIFILVAENDAQILPTLLSRCQIIKVPTLSPANISEALITRNHTAPDTAARIAAACQGNYREAMQMARHANEDWQALLRDWLNAIIRTKPIAQAKWVDEMAKLGREKQKQFLRYFNHLLQLAVTAAILPQSHKHFAPNDTDFALRLNRITGLEQQEAIIKEIDNAAYYIERNANAKMLFMALTIKIYHIIKHKIVFLND